MEVDGTPEGPVHEGPADGAAPPGPPHGWETPSLKAIAPSLIGGAVIPLGVYYLVRSHVGGDAPALVIAGIPAVAWVTFHWVRRRQIDPIGAIVLFGFVVGVAVSYALGGNAFVLKVRDSAFTFLFGLASLLTLWLGSRPLMFYIGRALSAGDDPARREAYNQLWEVPPARLVFRVLAAVWGTGLILEAAVRVMLASVLPTGRFLEVSPVVGFVFIGTMFAFTAWFSRWSRRRIEVVMALNPQASGSGWWWMRRMWESSGEEDDRVVLYAVEHVARASRPRLPSPPH
jgi:hypothetical protein